MARTAYGYHGFQRKKNTDAASFRNPPKDRCGYCNRVFLDDEKRFIELRPTGHKFEMQKHYFCSKCRREFK